MTLSPESLPFTGFKPSNIDSYLVCSTAFIAQLSLIARFPKLGIDGVAERDANDGGLRLSDSEAIEGG